MEPINAVVLCSFNFKGGVGKTSTSINLADQLVRSDNKVLLIDGDPSRNLTTFYQPGTEHVCDEDENVDFVLNGSDILSIPMPSGLDPLHFVQTQDNAWLQGADDIRSALMEYMLGLSIENIKLPTLVDVNIDDYAGKLQLLPGSAFLSEIQSHFEKYADTPMAVPVYSCLRHMIRRLVEKHSFDYVIIDLAPSQDLLNKIFVMSSDAILPSVDASMFSVDSVKSLLSVVLPDWYAWQRETSDKLRALTTHYHTNAGFCFHSKPPKILPFLAHRFKVQRGKVQWSDANLLATLNMTVDLTATSDIKAYFVHSGGSMVIPFCPELRCMPISQEIGRPMVRLTVDHLADYYQNSGATLTGKISSNIFKKEVIQCQKLYESVVRFIHKYRSEILMDDVSLLLSCSRRARLL